MKPELVAHLVCPECRASLKLSNERVGESGEIETGTLVCLGCAQQYPITNFIPRFVPVSNYAANFGWEWTVHAETQIDKFNGTTITKDRFFRETKWDPRAIKEQRILEAGSGAGRFTQVVLDAGAVLFSFDLSEAVESNFATNGSHPNLNLVQASIHKIPFPKASFEKIFCLGVLQHTPDPQKSFASLLPYLAKNGEIVVDIYARKSIVTFIQAKYLLRPITTRMENERLHRVIKAITPPLLRIGDVLNRVPLIGPKVLLRFLPISMPPKYVPDHKRLEWTILNTFDAYSPRYDQPQSRQTLRQWFEQGGLTNIEIFQDPGVAAYVGRGTMP